MHKKVTKSYQQENNFNKNKFYFLFASPKRNLSALQIQWMKKKLVNIYRFEIANSWSRMVTHVVASEFTSKEKLNSLMSSCLDISEL